MTSYAHRHGPGCQQAARVSHSQPAQARPTEVQLLIAYNDYVAYRPHLFPSPNSGAWFIRKHRVELIRSGALLLVCGRHMVQPSLFDAYVLNVGRRVATEVAGISS